MLPTFCPLTIWAISMEFCRQPYILEADNFLGACYTKAMTPKKLWTLLFLEPSPTRRFLQVSLIFADARLFLEHKISQETADFRRKPQKTVGTRRNRRLAFAPLGLSLKRGPPWHLVSHRHICAMPHFATCRAIIV